MVTVYLKAAIKYLRTHFRRPSFVFYAHDTYASFVSANLVMGEKYREVIRLVLYYRSCHIMRSSRFMVMETKYNANGTAAITCLDHRVIIQ